MANYMKRDQRANAMRVEITKSNSPAKRSRASPGRPPTFGDESQAGCSWFWFLCPNCHRRTPRALAPFAIRYGMGVPIVYVAKFAVCQGCRHRGALLQRPAVVGAGADMSREAFPTELALRGLEHWVLA